MGLGVQRLRIGLNFISKKMKVLVMIEEERRKGVETPHKKTFYFSPFTKKSVSKKKRNLLVLIKNNFFAVKIKRRIIFEKKEIYVSNR